MSEKKTNEADQETAEVLGRPTTTTLDATVPESLNTEKKNPEAFKDMFTKVGKINVKPFIDNTKENMGLENYGMAVFPGIYHEEQLASIERHGVERFITGLDEFAPEVQNIKDPEQKAAVIYNIRSVITHLEKLLATNVISIDDDEFWNKVSLLRPDNKEFWGKISIRCGNDPVTLEPGKDPYDLVKFMAIEAGGFDLIAKSHEDGMAKSVAPKFFLDKEVYTVSSRTTYKRLRNKAIGLLDSISNSNVTKLLYITKAIDSSSISYKTHTPADILYDVMDDYINGHGVEANKKKAAEYFILTAELGMETLKLKALVKDASFLKIINLKPDGMLYHTSSSVMLGRNVSDVISFLKSPLNEDLLMKLLKEIEDYWNN